MTSRAPLLLGLVLCTAPAVANADLPPPLAISACEGATADTACKLESGEAGRCAPSKCSKLDYSKGSPPQSLEYDCLRCEAGAVKEAAAAPASAGGESSKQPPAVQSRCAVEPAVGLLGVLVGLLGLRRRRRS